MPEAERRLAAIMFTDIAGYTSLSQRNETLALQLLEEHRSLLRPFFPRHAGKEIKTIGDGFLVEFASALEAVRCAFEMQRSLHERNAMNPPGRKVTLRIGIHLGDVVHNQDDVYGDAVNIASRIEPLADPGGICLTEQVYDHVRNKLKFPIVSAGRREVKNVEAPLEVYKVVLPWEERASSLGSEDFDERRIAVLPFANISPDPNDEYFADGMTEELISAISKIPELTVISRTSVMKYKGGGRSIQEIRPELKVGTMLEGGQRTTIENCRMSLRFNRT
ncbi:MAG: adenylate/guanylate cyclase domain-containing protein [Thaumarchaeota archaeon]|nr:MAG: adenylate/guanylate cyclase domain-containing protein [Nitrososphaerota archaeon]